MTAITQTLTAAQFDALAELSSYQKNASVREAMRLHFVTGLPLADAARQTNILYRTAWRAAQKLDRRYALAWKAVGITTEKDQEFKN